MSLSEEDRVVIRELTASNTRLAQETAVQNGQIAEIREILFGKRADGFLYEFATVRKDIQSIPTLAASLHDLVDKVDDMSIKITPFIKRVAAINRYIMRQRIKTAVLTTVVAGFVSFVSFALMTWSGIKDIVKEIKP